MSRGIMGLMMVMAVGSLAGQANATLTGDTVNFLLEDSLESIANVIPASAIVGPGVEATITPGLVSVDLDDSSITLTALTTILFNGDEVLTISDLDWVGTPGRIVGFGLNTNITGLTESDISFGDDFVRIVLGNDLQTVTGNTAVIDLEVVHDNNNAVPEPITATLGLMGLGVLGMATRRRVA